MLRSGCSRYTNVISILPTLEHMTHANYIAYVMCTQVDNINMKLIVLAVRT